MNINEIFTALFISYHLRSVFHVVTDDCHSNASFVSHVTVYRKWILAKNTVRIDDVITTDVADACLHFGAGFRLFDMNSDTCLN